MGIVIVFLVGLVKLWAANRHVRRLEALDAEKQARAVQMRKSGLTLATIGGGSSKARPGGLGEIPFGVKALEIGIEVEGVWVARMASLASRPPERKWNSRRKVRFEAGLEVGPPAAASSHVKTRELNGPGKRARRVSRGARGIGAVSRREIMEPSSHTRDKLENLALLEEERQSKDTTNKDRDEIQVEGVDDQQPKSSHHGHKRALGRIQRGLKKMTSSETWQDQNKHQGDGRLDAKEFHEKARAKKPQRFYPTSPTRTRDAEDATTIPLVAPQARSQITRQRVDTILHAHGLNSTNGPSTADARARNETRSDLNNSRPPAAHQVHRQALRQQNSIRSTSSADSFVTTVEEPEDLPSSRPRRRVRMSSGGNGDGGAGDGEGRGLRQRPDISPRRSSLRHSLSRESRNSSSKEDNGDAGRVSETAQGTVVAMGPVNRYPPNSSRSAPAPQRRSSSSTQQQQQTGSTPPNLTNGPGQV